VKRAGKQVLEELVIGTPRPDKRAIHRHIDFWLTMLFAGTTWNAISEALGPTHVSRRFSSVSDTNNRE
jgi:hypothetical protein